MNDQIVTINLVPGSSAPAVVRVSQYDVGRPLTFKILDGTSNMTLPSGTTATIEGTKPSGLGFSVAGTLSGNTVTVDTTIDMTQESGMIAAEIRFTQGTTDIGTANFILAVEKTPHAEGTTDGTQESMANLETRLQGQIDDLSDRIDDIEAGGSGLSQTEKNLILTLFSKAAYAESDAETAYDALENLWTTTTRTVTYNLSHVSSSNTTASIESGQSYTTTLTATGGYSINSVIVTMGGVDITSTAYSSGTITIPSVTGDIVITATAVLAAQSITATYTQSGTVYDTDSLDSLKADLVVTANYSGGTSEIVPASDYTLSGTLTVGTSIITVTYAGLTDTFSVTVTQDGAYWDYTMGLPADNGFTLMSTESADPVQTLESDGLLITVKGPNTEYTKYSYDTTQSQSIFEVVFMTGSVTNEQHLMYISTDSNNTGIGLRIQYSGNYKGIYILDAEAIADMTFLTSITLNTQYKIKLEVVNNLANIYVNDTLLSQGQTLNSRGASNTYFMTRSSSSSTSRINAKLVSIRVK